MIKISETRTPQQYLVSATEEEIKKLFNKNNSTAETFILLSDDDMELLKVAEDRLECMHYHQYLLPPTKGQNDAVWDVYDRITKNKNQKNYTCNQCLGKAYRIVGLHYCLTKALKDEIITNDTYVPEVLTTQTVQEVVVKKKAGRPKKSK